MKEIFLKELLLKKKFSAWDLENLNIPEHNNTFLFQCYDIKDIFS